MAKQIIRLTESDLRRLVSSSVKKIIKESPDINQRVNALLSSVKPSMYSLLDIYTNYNEQLDDNTANEVTMFLGDLLHRIDMAVDDMDYDDDFYDGLDDDELHLDESEYVN